MEIKTKEELVKGAHEELTLLKNSTDFVKQVELVQEDMKKRYVAVDDIYNEIDKCGQYRDNGQYVYDFVMMESLLSKLKAEKN